jgi:hypothetical protein
MIEDLMRDQVRHDENQLDLVCHSGESRNPEEHEFCSIKIRSIKK